MKKKSIFAALLIIIVLLLSGCLGKKDDSSEILITIDSDDYRIFLYDNKEPVEFFNEGSYVR